MKCPICMLISDTRDCLNRHLIEKHKYLPETADRVAEKVNCWQEHDRKHSQQINGNHHAVENTIHSGDIDDSLDDTRRFLELVRSFQVQKDDAKLLSGFSASSQTVDQRVGDLT